MSDSQEKQEDTRKPERDELGRLLPGNTANPNGRPRGLSLLAIIRDKLQKTVLTDAGEISLAEALTEEYLRKAAETNDGVAIRDLMDRLDGKPTQTQIVKTDKLSDLAEAFKEIAKEKDE